MVTALYQYLVVFFANISTFSYAISVGWTGNVLNLYDSDKSPLPSGRVALDELAWIGSMLGVGGVAGTLVIGWLADRIGRKYSLIVMAAPQIFGFMLILYAQNVYYLYASRFLLGFAGASVYVVVPLMVTEVVEARIRGRLGTMLVVASSGGTLIGFIGGHYLDYFQTPRFCLLGPIIFIVLYSFMPETPYYLMKVNRVEEAEESFRFYRNVKLDHDDKELTHELLQLKCSFSDVEQVNGMSGKIDRSSLKVRDFLNRPFSICCVLMIAREVCGIFTMISYASIIFAKSGSSLSPGISSIVIGVIQVIGTYVATMFIDRLGRKILMVSSFAGCAVCHAILATYIFLSTATDINVNNFNWVPVASFSAMIFISACGAMPVPYVVIGEILPNKIRNLGITFCMCLSWAVTFIAAKSFPFLMQTIELYGCIYLFALFCVATVVYLVVAVPETKGRSLDYILETLKVHAY